MMGAGGWTALRLCSWVIMCLLASPVGAGAWLREDGRAFASLSFGVFSHADGSRSETLDLYGEFGWRANRTLGLKFNFQDGALDEGEVFLRLPFGSETTTWKRSAEFGLGALKTTTGHDPQARVALSFGRGFEWRKRYGWANVDLARTLAQNSDNALTKLDITVGLATSDRLKIMGQAFLEASNSEANATFTTSWILDPKGVKAQFVVGLEQRVGDLPRTGLKVSLWREF